MFGNIWDFMYEIYLFFIEMIGACFNLWNASFEIGDYVIKFKDILTTSLGLVIGLILIKKLIPAA